MRGGEVLDQGAEKHVRDKHVRGNGATEFDNVPGDGTTFANHVGAKDVQNLKQIWYGVAGGPGNSGKTISKTLFERSPRVMSESGPR